MGAELGPGSRAARRLAGRVRGPSWVSAPPAGAILTAASPANSPFPLQTKRWLLFLSLGIVDKNCLFS